MCPIGRVIKTSRRYRGDTLILETEFETAQGCVRLTDCMPLRDEFPDIVRKVEGAWQGGNDDVCDPAFRLRPACALGEEC